MHKSYQRTKRKREVSVKNLVLSFFFFFFFFFFQSFAMSGTYQRVVTMSQSCLRHAQIYLKKKKTKGYSLGTDFSHVLPIPVSDTST